MRPRLLIIILLSVLTGHSIADTNPSSPSVSDAAELLANANIEGLKALPVHNLKMVKAGGKTFFMEHGYRRFHKYGGVAVTITQSVNDLYRIAVKVRLDLAVL